MPMQLPADLEAMVERRLAGGRYQSAEEVLRSALQAQEAEEAEEAEESWSEEDRLALDEKIDRAMAQVAAGNTYGPEEARQKLAAMREARLLSLSR